MAATLIAYFVRCPAGGRFMSPAFPAIYGGFYVGFGAIYAGADFSPNPDVLAARLSTQFEVYPDCRSAEKAAARQK